MTALPPVILATCRNPPVDPDDDPRLADALRKAGRDVRLLPWTDLDPSDLPAGSAVILRSVWDYHRQPQHFLAWLEALVSEGVTILNPPELVRLTIDKSYLTADRPFGCTAPVTVRVPSTLPDVMNEVASRGWKRFILKPPVSASADGTFLLYADDKPAIETALGDQPDHILIQEFLPEIRDGELSLVFFGGWFSHAVRKIPANGDFRVQSEFGSHTAPIRPPAPVIAAARHALRHLPEVPCYARVDGVMRGDQFILMELELIEPELFLSHSPGAAEVFAETITRRLTDASSPAA